ncbi:MAG: response regulator transcription factor [Desulfobacteraceae bacterium]|jgi:DNA-binding NarL/FixJ family response regulator|nr:response regulator transcription factor [Desulfobacteraceae bacterium]
MTKKRILIVEDHPIFRLGLTELINQEEDLEVCAGASDVAKAWQAIEAFCPDLVIADISLPKGDGIDLAKEIARQFKGRLPVVILSMHDAFLYAERALHAGARGYIMKEEAMEKVVSAVRDVLAGRIYLNDKVKEHILTNLTTHPGSRDKSPLERLTDRELEVFRFLSQGLSSRDIARRLNLSIKTIGTYRERIKEKLHLKHSAELVRYAVHWASQESGEESL